MKEKKKKKENPEEKKREVYSKTEFRSMMLTKTLSLSINAFFFK